MIRLLVCLLFLATLFTRLQPLAATTCVATDPPTPCPPTGIRAVEGYLAGWIDLDNEIVLESLRTEDSIKLEGIDLQSNGSYFEPAPIEQVPEPFLFKLSNSESQVTFGRLGAELVDQTLKSGVIYDLSSALTNSNPCEDVQLIGGRLRTRRTQFCTIAGDANFDGTVTFGDFLLLSNNFGAIDAVWPQGDFDWDRRVGFSDFLVLSEHFGQSIPELETEGNAAAANVPEPSGLWLTLIGIIALSRLRTARGNFAGKRLPTKKMNVR